MEMFKVEHDRYPEREVGPGHVELAEILKRIGIYEHTRWSGNTNTRADRGYLFWFKPDNSGYNVVVFEPIYNFPRKDGPSYNGELIYRINESGVVEETPLAWNSSISSVSGNLCSLANDGELWDGIATWSYNIPTAYAP